MDRAYMDTSCSEYKLTKQRLAKLQLPEEFPEAEDLRCMRNRDSRMDVRPQLSGAYMRRVTAICETSFNSDFLANTKNPRREPRLYELLLLNHDLLHNYNS